MFNTELTPMVKINCRTAAPTKLTDASRSLMDRLRVSEKRLAVPIVIGLHCHGELSGDDPTRSLVSLRDGCAGWFYGNTAADGTVGNTFRIEQFQGLSRYLIDP